MRVSLSGITVRFGRLTAVDDVSLDFEPGEIHAVVGENGAGKSTLMNALFGLVKPQEGVIAIDGVERRWNSPQDAIAAGLGMVHQHFMLQDEMTVLENIVLCTEPVGRLGFVRFRAARETLEEQARRHGIRLDRDRRVAGLSVGERQLVEILKLLYRDSRVLILDEPTSVLTPGEKDQLFAILRSFRDEGRAIMLITHKLDEVMELADRVSVMRGGRLVATGPLAGTSREEIARGIVGGAPPEPRKRSSRAPGAAVLEVAGLRMDRPGRRIGPLDLTVRAGEIVGIAGVSGNGQIELVRALVGIDPLDAGRLRLNGGDITSASIGRRRAAGMSYIPEDRQRAGLALAASVAENANAGRRERSGYARGPFLKRGAMAGYARKLIERYSIRVAGASAAASTMSGGNKQKLVVARELARDTPLVIAENPTWGVDIGAIDFIHGELARMRDEGHAVLLVSTELDEILALSDRILVMYAGGFSGELAGDGADREALGRLMTSGAAVWREIA